MLAPDRYIDRPGILNSLETRGYPGLNNLATVRIYTRSLSTSARHSYLLHRDALISPLDLAILAIPITADIEREIEYYSQVFLFTPDKHKSSLVCSKTLATHIVVDSDTSARMQT